MVYLPTFGWFLGQMLVNIPYMEHMGYGIQSIWLTVICLLMWQWDTINSNRTIWTCSSFQCHIAMEPMTYSYPAELHELQGLEGTIPFSQSFHGTYSIRPSKSSTAGYKWRICNSQLPYYPLVNTQKAMENGHLKWIYPLKLVIFHSFL